MNGNLLPTFYKTIGLIIGITTLIAFLLNDFYIKWLNVDQSRFDLILKLVILISLVIIVFSKEKYETKQISDLRLRELKGSISAGIIVFILDSLKELIFWDGEFDNISSFGLLIIILILHLITFNSNRNKLIARS